MYTYQKRSADLMADEETIIYEINLETLHVLGEINPAFVAHFHQCIASILARRLIEQNKRVELFNNT